MEAVAADPASVLRRAGVRVTAPRLAVLAALAATGPHPRAEAVVGAVSAQLGHTSPQTVYNVLRAFVGAGLVRRIEPAGSPGLYDLRVGDNHHHLVCRRCGAVTDVDCAVGSAPCLEPSQTNGFLVDEAELTYWGLCPRCRGDGPSSDGASGRSAVQAEARRK